MQLKCNFGKNFAYNFNQGIYILKDLTEMRNKKKICVFPINISEKKLTRPGRAGPKSLRAGPGLGKKLPGRVGPRRLGPGPGP